MEKILVANKDFDHVPFKNEAELEKVVVENFTKIFEENSYYFDIKKGIRHQKGDLLTIPDGYLLTFGNNPTMTVIENELSTHDVVKHIALQFAKFHSALTETSKYSVKKFLIEYLKEHSQEEQKIEKLMARTRFKSVSDLLDAVIMDQKVEFAIVIDEKTDELERVVSPYNPDIHVLKKYECGDEIIYHIEDEGEQESSQKSIKKTLKTPMRRLPEMDTIVCPAQEEGFNDVFLKEHRWFEIRIHPKRIPKIKYLAMYETKPISAIRYIGKVKEIRPYKNTGKYEVILEGEPIKIKKPIKLSKDNPNLAPQSPKYTVKNLLDNAETLDDIFG